VGFLVGGLLVGALVGGFVVTLEGVLVGGLLEGSDIALVGGIAGVWTGFFDAPRGAAVRAKGAFEVLSGVTAGAVGVTAGATGASLLTMGAGAGPFWGAGTMGALAGDDAGAMGGNGGLGLGQSPHCHPLCK
jgi:hypothetical protein